jgi:DsbC/DsbD-like thiol-disulfide interchange protein/cytochrome c biogenesis protein CcdA
MTRLARLLVLLLALLAAPAAAQLTGGQPAMDVSLVAGERTGDRVELAFVMRPHSGWHGYWQNPGDAGQPASVEWTLPPGATAGPLRYPVPQRLLISGLMNYVFERDYALIAELRLPPGAAPSLPVTATIRYLACTDRICVPQSATVSADAAKGGSLAAWKQALPRPLGGEGRFEVAGGRLRLAVPMPASTTFDDPYFFPLTERAADYAAPQRVSRSGDWLIIETKAGEVRPSLLEGVLAIGGGQGLSLTARPGTVPAAGAPVAAETKAKAPAGTTLLAALAGALLGGLLLNVMPCVFPILSLKALSLARAGGDERAARREALAYSAGVVLVCVALGAVLLAVRAGGAAVGWAFQLQDPRVTLFLLLLMGAITLNLAGLFELPSVGAGGGLTARGGTAGAFWTGALAAFVATPCTGPFMGAALGAALVLPPAAALAVFAGLGLGLALPFLLLGFVPALRRLLPRPGAWMVTFRRILAVPMALTALWLGWLLYRQAGQAAILVGLAALLVSAALLAWAGRRQAWLPFAPAAAAAAAAMLLLPTAAAPAASAPGLLQAEPFSEARLAALRASGRPVFVYFTADWCLTCKVNEKAVLERSDVAAAFDRGKVAVLVGDWTRGNAEIGRFLEKQGRSGVPLYLWYPPGGDAEVLPQVLTVGRVAGLVG